MAASNFTTCLKLVLGHEGGWSSHPKDPGGDTMMGVTQATYDSYRRSKGRPPRSVRYIADSEVKDIYRSRYWMKVKGDELPAGIDYSTFDAGVNSGPARGVKWLQKAVGAVQDGIAGPETISKARNSDHRKTIVSMCAARMGFLRGLSHWSAFGKGWSRRVAEVEASAVAMVLSQTLPAPGVQSEMEAEAKKANTAAKGQQAGAATSGTSGGATATTVDWTSWDTVTPWIVGGCVLALVILALVLIHKSRVNKARARAYAAAAKEQAA